MLIFNSARLTKQQQLTCCCCRSLHYSTNNTPGINNPGPLLWCAEQVVGGLKSSCSAPHSAQFYGYRRLFSTVLDVACESYDVYSPPCLKNDIWMLLLLVSKRGYIYIYDIALILVHEQICIGYLSLYIYLLCCEIIAVNWLFILICSFYYNLVYTTSAYGYSWLCRRGQ